MPPHRRRHAASVAVLACSIFACLLLLATVASAHFQVTSPTARTFVESLENVPPCGGQALGSRVNFPIEGGTLSGQSYHASATANLSVALTADPKPADFALISGYANQFTVKLGNFKTAAVSLSAVAKVGAVATIQMSYDAGDGLLFQCVDVTLVAASTTNSTTNTTTSAAAPAARRPPFESAVAVAAVALAVAVVAL